MKFHHFSLVEKAPIAPPLEKVIPTPMVRTTLKRHLTSLPANFIA